MPRAAAVVDGVEQQRHAGRHDRRALARAKPALVEVQRAAAIGASCACQRARQPAGEVAARQRGRDLARDAQSRPARSSRSTAPADRRAKARAASATVARAVSASRPRQGLISTLMPSPSSRQSASASSKVGTRSPRNAGANQLPASSRRISARVARGEPPAPVGGPLEPVVVEQDRVAVAGQLDVELDPARAELLRPADAGQRVLRAPPRPPRDGRSPAARTRAGGAARCRPTSWPPSTASTGRPRSRSGSRPRAAEGNAARPGHRLRGAGRRRLASRR